MGSNTSTCTGAGVGMGSGTDSGMWSGIVGGRVGSMGSDMMGNMGSGMTGRMSRSMSRSTSLQSFASLDACGYRSSSLSAALSLASPLAELNRSLPFRKSAVSSKVLELPADTQAVLGITFQRGGTSHRGPRQVGGRHTSKMRHLA